MPTETATDKNEQITPFGSSQLGLTLVTLVFSCLYKVKSQLQQQSS